MSDKRPYDRSWAGPSASSGRDNYRRSADRQIPVDFRDFLGDSDSVEPAFSSNSSRRRSRSPPGREYRSRNRSPLPLSPPKRMRSRTPPGRSRFSSYGRSPAPDYSSRRRDWREHNPNDILDGVVKEYIDDFTGLMEIEFGGESFTAFFHATAVWLVNPDGNPYGAPAKFTDVLGRNTATTRENTNISLFKEVPVGSEVLLKAIVSRSNIVQFVVLSMWPKSTEPPPQPQNENEQKISEKKQEYFLKEFHNKVESLKTVEATIPGCLPTLYPDIRATIWEIKTPDFGLIEIKGHIPKTYRFFALFHKEDLWLRDGKLAVSVDFFKHKPLETMCQVGQPVNIIARSILSVKGSALVPALVELQAVVVSMDPDRIPAGASKPTWCPGGPGVYGSTMGQYCRFLQHNLYDQLNAKLRNFLLATGQSLPNLDPNITEVAGHINAVQIKKERFEEAQQQQQQQGQETSYPSYQSQMGLPQRHSLPPPQVVIPGPLGTGQPNQVLHQQPILPNHQASMAGSQIPYQPVLPNSEAGMASSQIPHHQAMPIVAGPSGAVAPQTTAPNFPDEMAQSQKQTAQQEPAGLLKMMKNQGGKVSQHFGKHCALVEDFSHKWRCLITTEHTLLPAGITNVAQLFPMSSVAKVNAHLINADKPIQYVASLVWSTKYTDHKSTIGKEKEISDALMMKYYEIVSTAGSVLKVADKVNSGGAGELEAAEAAVFQILDDNFAILKTIYGLVLCDTCDFWVDPENTASKLSKTFDQVSKVGDEVLFHACLIDSKSRIQYLATSVWHKRNHAIEPSARPAPIKKTDIHEEKIKIYHMVVKSVEPTLDKHAALTSPPPMMENALVAVPGVVRSVFMDKKWLQNSTIVGGIVSMLKGSGVANTGKLFAFFMSKNLVQFGIEPKVGTEFIINAHPIMTSIAGFYDVSHIATVLYPRYMQPTHEQPQNAQFKMKESIAKLQEIVNMYPDCTRNIMRPNALVRDVTQATPAQKPSVEAKKSSSAETIINVQKARIKCMISDTAGVLESEEKPEVLAYFELDDLNIEKPFKLIDAVMMMNRMKNIDVRFQAKLINDRSPLPYVTNHSGVQIVGTLPTYMMHIRLKQAEKSHMLVGYKQEKMSRYKEAEVDFLNGRIRSIANILEGDNATDGLDVQSVGVVKNILNENFGLLEGPTNSSEKHICLFDTYDLYLADNQTAAVAGKPVEEVLKVGDEVVYNACFIEQNLPVRYLATSLWKSGNKSMSRPESSLARAQIQEDKLKIFFQVSQSCSSIVKALKQADGGDQAKNTPKKTVGVSTAELIRRQEQIDRVRNGEAYKAYIKSVAKDKRKPKDPQTPDRDDADWQDKMNAWKSSLQRLQAGLSAGPSKAILVKNPELNDDNTDGVLKTVISPKYAVFQLSNGAEAVCAFSRLWLSRGPAFGTWNILYRGYFSRPHVNARKISPPVHGVDYQITFGFAANLLKIHQKWAYPADMKEWIEKTITEESLDKELAELQQLKPGFRYY